MWPDNVLLIYRADKINNNEASNKNTVTSTPVNLNEYVVDKNFDISMFIVSVVVEGFAVFAASSFVAAMHLPVPALLVFLYPLPQ